MRGTSMSSTGRRGVKVRYPIARLALILVLVPFLLSCEITPEDKWPEIVDTEINANLNVTLELLEGFGIPQIKVPNRQIEAKVTVRTYHGNQPWTVHVVLDGVRVDKTFYEGLIPTQTLQYAVPVTETFLWENYTGSYLGGGHPPQGNVLLTLTFEPDYFPVYLSDWISFDIDPDTGGLTINWINDRYYYDFVVIIEDAEKRSDTFDFTLISELIIEEED